MWTAILAVVTSKPVLALLSAGAGWLYRHIFPPASAAPVTSLAAATTELVQVDSNKAADAIAKDGL